MNTDNFMSYFFVVMKVKYKFVLIIFFIFLKNKLNHYG